MKNFVTAVLAALASMGRLMTKLVWEGGRWVSRLVREPSQPVQMPSTTSQSKADQAEDYSNIKRIAGCLAKGIDPTPADLKGASELTVRWLGSMDRDALLKVALADPAAIRDHMKRRQPIKGLVPYEKEAVADVTAARSAPRAAERQRTLRDELEEQLGVRLAA